MPSNCPDKNPLIHDGSSQMQRVLAALDPASAPLMEFGSEEWMAFAYQYAYQLNYFDTSDAQSPNSHWQDFFIEPDDISSFLAAVEQKAETEPHLALFICFLRLLENSRKAMNQLTAKHLNFYYQDVLQLKRQAATPDTVHLIFELAKNAADQRIIEGTQFNGDKDANGQIRWYAAQEELIVNPTQVSQLQGILHYQGDQIKDKRKNIYYAAQSNSADGLGAEFTEENPSWHPFGHPTLPAANLGFILASPVLQLKEGQRTIVASLTLTNTKVLSIAQSLLLQNIQIYLTGEEEWLGPFQPVAKDVDNNTITAFTKTGDNTYELSLGLSLSADEPPIVSYQADLHGLRLNTLHPAMRILFVPDTEDAPGSYTLYNSLKPTRLQSASISVDVKGMKEVIVENDYGPLDASKSFLPFGPQPSVGSNFFVGNNEIFDKNWTSINLDINWQELPESLKEHYKAYQNNFLSDLSKVNYPLYTTTDDPPKSGEQVLAMAPIDELTIADQITGLFPIALVTNGLYQIYGKSTPIVTNASYFTAAVELLNQKAWNTVSGKTAVPLFTDPEDNTNTQSSSINIGIDDNPVTPASASECYYLKDITAEDYNTRKAILESYLHPDKERQAIFDNALFPATANQQTDNELLSAATKKGFVRLKLNQQFFHKIYPQLYAVAISKTQDDNALIPNEPYTPMIESMALSYTASTEQVFVFSGDDRKSKLLDFEARQVQLFHETPLGQHEQHRFFKDQYDFTNKNIYLLPQFDLGGELYIGLSKAQPLSSVNMLVQVAEGSENPLSPTFEEDDGINWDIMCSNEWKPLDTSFLLGDTTNDFLTSGLMRFLLPAEATSQNTMLAPDYIWLRARIKTPYQYDSVCKVMGIHAQALTTQFEDQNNELSHLQTALPAGTISKMKERQALIKKITQPYSSFGGFPQESPADFYLRVSQRLRHKQRAVTIWDYEQLVLQKFPSIYKAKCLNHTATPDPTITDPVDPRFAGSELAPGFVSMVVIPDIRNKNAYNKLKPRVSKNTLTQIEDFLRELCSMQVEVNAANPDYESIRLKFEVVFYSGFDPTFYKQQLDTDIVNYLSPWNSDEQATIQFGGTVHRSVMINFIEQRPYVDYVANFQMKHFLVTEDDTSDTLFNSKSPQRKIQASNGKAILGSAPSHFIDVLTPENCAK